MLQILLLKLTQLIISLKIVYKHQTINIVIRREYNLLFPKSYHHKLN